MNVKRNVSALNWANRGRDPERRDLPDLVRGTMHLGVIDPRGRRPQCALILLRRIPGETLYQRMVLNIVAIEERPSRVMKGGRTTPVR